MKIKTIDDIKPSISGQIVCKPSGKPFSNGLHIDKVVEIVVNPQNPKGDLGARLKYCGDIVDIRNLKVLVNFVSEDLINLEDPHKFLDELIEVIKKGIK